MPVLCALLQTVEGELAVELRTFDVKLVDLKVMAHSECKSHPDGCGLRDWGVHVEEIDSQNLQEAARNKASAVAVNRSRRVLLHC